MPVVYDAPIGPVSPNGASLLPITPMQGQTMLSGIPIPSITGGAAGESGAASGNIRNYINATSGATGSWLFISIAAIAGLIIWKKMKK